MPDVALLFSATPTSLGVLVLDAAVSVGHKADVELTQHPVESGARITDHRRLKPRTVDIEGVISNTPLGADPDPGRAKAAYAQLLALRAGSELIRVVTPLDTFERMSIVALSVPTDAKTGQSLRFNVSLEEVFTVVLKVVNVAPKHKAKVSLGKKAALPAAEAKRKTFLKFGADTDVGNTVLKAFGLR